MLYRLIVNLQGRSNCEGLALTSSVSTFESEVGTCVDSLENGLFSFHPGERLDEGTFPSVGYMVVKGEMALDPVMVYSP